MYIQLEECDLQNIAEEILKWGDTECSSFEYSDLCITVEFSRKVYFHQVGNYEDGYEYITDDVSFSVIVYDNEVEVRYDKNLLNKYISKALWGQE